MPASVSFRIATIWVSVKRDFFIRTSWGNLSRKLYFWGVHHLGKLTTPLQPCRKFLLLCLRIFFFIRLNNNKSIALKKHLNRFSTAATKKCLQ